MKCFILLALFVGLAVAGDEQFYFNEIETKWKKWSEWKAYETCYGREFMEEYQIRSKKASQKCYGKEVPELKVWEMLKPERLVMAMMRGLKNNQDKKVKNMIKSMTKPQEQQTMAFMPFQQFQQEKSDSSNGEMKMMMKMMKLMMMKEMMTKMVSPTDMMAGAGGMDEGVVSARGLQGNEDDFEMASFFRQLLKAAAERRATASSVVRSRRAAEAADYKDLYDLGDKLAEKLEAMKESYMTEMGNMTCWFHEMKVVNEKGDLDLDLQLADLETWTWDSQWFKEKGIEGVRKCYTMAVQTPAEIFTTNKVDEQWMRIRTWYKCIEEVKRWSCMGLDIKRMLERHFGNTQELIDETGMDEETLLYMTQAIMDESM